MAAVGFRFSLHINSCATTPTHRRTLGEDVATHHPHPAFASLQYGAYGALIGEYRGGGIARVIGTGILVAFMVILGVLLVAAPVYENSGKALVVDIVGGIVLLAGALYFVWMAFRLRGARAHLFEQGFIISLGGQTTSARWDEITSVNEKVTRIYHYGIPVGTNYLYTIALANGETVRVNNAFAKTAQLGGTIQRMSMLALLPRAVAAYQSGTTLSFGKISISQAGVSNGKETVPWSSVTQFSRQNRAVVIRRKDKRLPWLMTAIARTPNVSVLMALVGRIQSGAL
jgi:hypothetical protein